ncbi:hypothetical protein DPMN_019548 [Dreissena polymorpha]|uniref:Uncharacterized protein n=1 Tax=Dreissena polymorpha TaxID=45954 RepID=A0A9D4NL10_DREPO|nr:hypothetical protein DPMN_019548 [Dreissena polymorpha]
MIYSHIRKNATPPDIIRTHLLTKFHEDWKINVASRVHIQKNAPPPGGHFDEDWTINVASRMKNAPPLGSHTNFLTKFHEHWTINVAFRVLTRKTAPPPGGHVFPPIWTIFELVRDINETNVLTKFHDDLAKIVTSRVFTRNTAPPPGGHVFQLTGTIFELNHNICSQGINGTNVLINFYEDQTINVASRVFTRQNVDNARRTTHDGQKAITKTHHEHVVLR